MAPTPSSTPRRPLSFYLKRLLELSRREWPWLALATLFLAFSSSATLLYPQAIGAIMDEATTSSDPGVIDRAAVIMAGIFVFLGTTEAIRYYLFTVTGERILARLRNDLYERIIAQEVGFFDARRTGELLNRLSSDTTVLQNTVSVNISMALRHSATVIGGLALLFYTSTTLAGIMVLVVPPISLAVVYFGRIIRRLSRQVQDALAEAGEVAEETIAGIRTVRAFTQESAEASRYGDSIDRSFELAKTRTRATAIFMGGASIAGYCAVALVLWYGGRLVAQEAMTVGALTSFVLYTLLVAFSLGALGGLWADFMRAAGATERVFNLMDRAPLIPTTGGLTPARLEGRVALNDVSFAYPTRPDVTVLSDIELTIEPGEIVALVGSSGGGKSTIASLIPRLYDPQEGTICFDEHDVKELDATWLRSQIGIVEQEPILFSTSIADNIRYGRPDATDAEVQAAAQIANAHDFIEDFPDMYNTQVGERGVQLSGGQKQRVAIARAVLKDPRVLILDEATSALDAESEHLVKEALDRLMRGRTTLIIAHRLSTVKDANRVIVIDQGRIVQSGSHARLLEEEGIYQKLIARQFVSAA